MKGGLSAALDRLEVTLDIAIAKMEAGEAVDDAAMAEAKGRALLELSRLGQLDKGRPKPEGLPDQLTRVKVKIAREQVLLGVRLDAAALVSNLIADALASNEWDGTYSPHPPHTSAARRAPR
ncbi:MAG: hypothetical protein AAGD34_01655 [Pseudomonadota bacterium]